MEEHLRDDAAFILTNCFIFSYDRDEIAVDVMGRVRPMTQRKERASKWVSRKMRDAARRFLYVRLLPTVGYDNVTFFRFPHSSKKHVLFLYYTVYRRQDVQWLLIMPRTRFATSDWAIADSESLRRESRRDLVNPGLSMSPPRNHTNSIEEEA